MEEGSNCLDYLYLYCTEVHSQTLLGNMSDEVKVWEVFSKEKAKTWKLATKSRHSRFQESVQHVWRVHRLIKEELYQDFLA